MNNRAFNRKIAYLAAIALLLLPIAALSQPAALSPKAQRLSSPGGKLSQLRTQYAGPPSEASPCRGANCGDGSPP